MQFVLLLLLLPVLWNATRVDSTELPFQLSNQERYQLNYKSYNTDFQTVPTNPNVFATISTFSDQSLTEKVGTIEPNQVFSIVGVSVNDQQVLVFQLEDQTYIAADPALIYDDSILSSQDVDQTYWTKADAVFYTSPIANQAQVSQKQKKAYQAVQVDRLAETHWGLFAHVEGLGWIAMEDLSATDNRMEAVQQLLKEKYDKDTLSIYVQQLETGQTAGVNEDKLMYAASTSKLATLYYAQEVINAGEFQLNQPLTYTKETLEFYGAFDASGSGSLPKTANNKEYSVEDLINRTAKESDNVASNILAYYTSHQFDATFTATIEGIVGQKWDMEERLASAKMAGKMMEKLYEQNGYVLESLKETKFDNQRISKDIPVPVAHKIGDAYDFRHDVAVVYTDSPFILSIFTEKSTYDTMSQIAKDVYEILK
ncbi:serine hydrolase [Streptococcus suis]|uniref:serine hydrolase n=1 Tax=Streptococcus suis TaxID=1307 RepID=UPI001ABE8D34|nr:serine hydrolase [Streptococcus suis]